MAARHPHMTINAMFPHKHFQLRARHLAVSTMPHCRCCSQTLTAFGPDGKIRETIPLPPERNVTNIAFGGPGLKTAYVTLTQTGKLVALDWPRKGLKLVNQ